MIPVSRSKGRGAYRNLVPNIINGVKEDTIFGTKVGNMIDTTRVNASSLNLGDFNKMKFYKRNIATPQLYIPYVANSNISLGDKNSGIVRLMHVNLNNDGEPQSNADYNLDIQIGNNNVLDFSVFSKENISIGDRNSIEGSLTVGDVEVGNDNFLIDFKAEVLDGTPLKGFAKIGSLMFTTEVADYAGAGQTFIEVADMSLIANDCEFFFGSVSAGFVRRVATSVVNGKVHFEEPLLFKESTFPGAQVFNEYQEIKNSLITNLAEEAPYRTKRIFLPLDESFHLRKILIDSVFETTVFFHRESDDMVIIKDLTPSVIPAGAPVTSPEVNPYREWITSVNQETTVGNEYVIGQTNFAYVGRTTIIDSVEYTISGYTENTIFISPELPVGTTHVTFPAIDNAPSGNAVETTIVGTHSGIIDGATVKDTTGLFIGQVVKIDGISKKLSILDIIGNTIIFDSTVFPSRLDNRFFIGGYEMPASSAEAKAEIAMATADTNTYLFGA